MSVNDSGPRSLIIGILIVVSIGSILIHDAGKLFPGLPITMVFIYCGILFHYFLSESDVDAEFYLILIVAATLFRTIFITIFTNSLIGFDPDTYVLSIQNLAESGLLDGFNNEFYESIPIFHLFILISHLLSNLPISSTLVIFPISVSIIAPLTVYVISCRILKNKDVAITAAILVSASATLVRFSNLPIPQLHTALTFSVFVFALIILIELKSRKVVMIILLLLVSMLYTHKIGLYITSGSLLLTGIIQYFQSRIAQILKSTYEHSWVMVCGLVIITSAWGVIAINLSYILLISGVGVLFVAIYKVIQTEPKSALKIRKGSSLFLIGLFSISVVFAMVQWTFLTTYLKALLVYRILPTLSSKGETILNQQSSFSHADTVDPGLFNPFFHQSHTLLILLTATLGLFFFLHKTGIHENFVPVLGVYTFIGHIVPLGLTSGIYGGIGIQRTALMLLPVSFPLSAIILTPQKKKSIFKGITLLVLVIIIGFQVFSVVATPDYPKSYRSYLNSEEVQGKSFGYEYIQGPIYTDYFYSTEAVNILPSTPCYNRGFSGKYESVGLKLLTGEIAEANYTHISLRTEIRVYRAEVRGGWVLNYDPHARTSAKYNSIYDNGGVIMYRQD